MLSNYIKLAWRTLLKHKLYSLIIISGLALGYASFILIYLHVRDELSYDRYHADNDRIYRVVKDFVNDDGTFLPDATTPPALAPAILQEIPEVELSVRLMPGWGDKYLVRYGDKAFYEKGRYRADSSILKLFAFEFIEGDRITALSKPDLVILTKSIARKYFGDEPALGKSIEIGQGDSRLKVVSGVIQDIPHNSHFHFDFLVSLPESAKGWSTNWNWYNWYTYIKLKPGVNISEVETKIISLFKKHNPNNTSRYYTQPLTDIHLDSKLKWELEPNSDMTFVVILATVAIFIILIASINYINLSISQGFDRSKEVGIRKVSGAYGIKLLNQFLTESIVASLIALVIAMTLVEVSLPFFNSRFGKEILPLLQQPFSFIAGAVLAAVVLGAFSGLYPSLYFSAFKPVQVLKGAFQPGNTNSWLRKGLVVMQFIISIALMAGTVIVIRQINFLKSKELGFSSDQVMIIENVQYLSEGKMHGMKEALLKLPQVVSVGTSNGVFGGQNWTTGMAAKGSENSSLINISGIDHDYIPVMDLKFTSGRNFLREFASDSDAIILNERAVRDFGLQGDPIGAQINDAGGSDKPNYLTVIGVVKDFHFANLRNEIKPYAFYLEGNRANNFTIKVNAADLPATLDGVTRAWSSFEPDLPFEYYFLDDTFEQQYAAEENFKIVFSGLTILAIYIACSGLFAIATYFIKRRRKEIGIRKVMGASVKQITWLVTFEFLLIVMLANIVAWPLAYFGMDRWLEGFAYRIELNWDSFAAAGLIAILIAVLTVSVQSIRSAMANPVNSLRSE